MSLNDRNGLAVAMTLVALLLALSIPTTVIGAEIVSPADGSVIRSPAIDLRYLAWAVPCDVTINDVTMQLPTCVNVTFEAIVGTNTLTVSDGISSDTATFTYLPNESELEPGIAPIRTLTPQSGNRKTVLPGFTIRGETSYAFSSVKIDGIELVGSVSADLRSSSGHRRIEIQPIAGRIRRITLEGVGLPQAIDLGLEEIPEGLSIDGRQSADAYAIDPTAIDFVNGTITKVAVGNTLWKCAQWEFSNRTCLGDWVYADRLQPGQQYEVLFDTVDPAYAETFDPDPALDLDIVALDNTTLVIAYVDSGSNHVSFEIWTTSGIRLVDETDVDTTGDANSRVALDVLNSSKFVIGFIDSPLDDAMFARYDRNGTQIQAPTQIDANAGTISDVDVCQIGDRFMEPWADSNDGDANYEIWSDAGVQTFNENQVDIAITPGAQGQDLVSCSAMNSTYFAYAFYDDADNDATVAAVLSSGTIAVAELDIDNNVGETGQVAVAGLRPDRFAMVFYDSTDDDITITVRNTTGAGFTTILANTDIDTNAGTDSRVAITEISNNGASEFVVAWNDNETGAIVAAVYNNAGTQVTAPFNITDQGNPANKLIDLAGYNSNLNTGICNSTFAIAYTNVSGNAVFDTFYRNGTHWNGICGAPDTTQPLIQLIGPANETVNTTSQVIDFYFNVSDASGIVNCTLIVDDVESGDLLNPVKDTTLNITAFLDNGEHLWAITCVDAELNRNWTENRTIIVNADISISGSDVSIVALDNRTLVYAYIDTGQNDASFEIWDTNGTLLEPSTDIDTTVDLNSRIAVDVINNTHFTIGVIDGPDQDTDFFIYDRYATQIVGQTQIDAATGAIVDVDVCQLGDRFAEPWADANDGDANYEIWSNAGVQTSNENQVDVGITPGANAQNLVSCSALNSSHWGYAFYDDVDNDATLALVLNTGTITVVETDIDNNVGETGQVAVAGASPDRVGMVFYDATDQDITLTVRNATGAALGTILANTDIDTIAGTDSRVAITEISNNGASEFVVAWNDNETGAIVAAVYNNAGTQVTAPFNITDQGNPANKLIDLAGYNSNLNTGICNSTFAIAYTNGSGTSVFKTFYRNGTSWDGICGAKPTLASTDLPANVVLNAGSTKVIACNISIDDLDGAVDIIEANATLYYHRNASLAQDHPSARYSNDSCAVIGTGTVQKNFTCSFEIQYFAPNGTWYCEMKARDGVGMFVLARPNLTIDPLYALNVTNTSLDFGSLVNGQVSSNLTENVTNVGNMRINITALGYGTVLGDGNAFACSGLNMSVDTVRFAPNATATYAQKERLNWSYKQLRISIARQDALGSPPDNISYWQAQVPANFTGQGLCNGTIVFQAEDGGQ